MSIKVKQGLQKCFIQIKDGTFDEDTIRMLLILSREYLPKDSLIRELAHFIAHTKRDQGLCHKKVNNRYAKWRLVQDQVNANSDLSELMKKIKTEDELSDFMLAGTGVEKIEARLFEILYFDGLEDIKESHLKKYTGLKRKEALKKLKKYYIKDSGFYIVNIEVIRKELKQIFLNRFNKNARKDPMILEVLDEYFADDKNIKEWAGIIKKELDSLQKVIRGTIEFKSAFTPKELNNEIYTAFVGVIEKFKFDQTFIKSIKENIHDVQLCIVTLLHDTRFVFYDGIQANVYICNYLNPPTIPTKENFEKQSKPEFVYAKGNIALCITYEVRENTMSIPLFVSDLIIGDYIDKTEFMKLYNSYCPTNEEIPWSTACRINEKLMLVKTDI